MTLMKKGIRVVEVDSLKPVPGEQLKAFWKPARGIIDQKVRECEWIVLKLDLIFVDPLHV